MSLHGVGIMKKPLNAIAAPVYGDIRRGPPQFKWSGKHWQVDVGRTLIETEHQPQLVESAVLVQSRDYNKQTVYGRSSHKDVVNENFRPPLLTMEDNLPLSRLPHPLAYVRLNPGTATSHGGFEGQVWENQASNKPGRDRYILTDDKVTHTEIRPTFHRPIDNPLEGFVNPDLEVKIPSVSVSSGFNGPALDAPTRPVELGEGRLRPSRHAGFDAPFKASGHQQERERDLRDHHYQASASAGYNPDLRAGVTPINIDLEDHHLDVSVGAGYNPSLREGLTPVNLDLADHHYKASASAGYNPDLRSGVTPVSIELADHHPSVSAHAGFNSSLRSGVTPVSIELLEKTPSASVSAGYNTPYSSGQIQQSSPNLEYRGPQTSATAGVNPSYRSGLTPVNLQLESKTTPISVSAGTSTRMHSSNQETRDAPRGDKIHTSYFVRPEIKFAASNGELADGSVRYGDRPTFAYTPTAESPFKDTNVSTHRPSFQQKAVGSGAAIKGVQSRGYVPRSGIATMPVNLRDRANPKPMVSAV